MENGIHACGAFGAIASTYDGKLHNLGAFDSCGSGYNLSVLAALPVGAAPPTFAELDSSDKAKQLHNAMTMQAATFDASADTDAPRRAAIAREYAQAIENRYDNNANYFTANLQNYETFGHSDYVVATTVRLHFYTQAESFGFNVGKTHGSFHTVNTDNILMQILSPPAQTYFGATNSQSRGLALKINMSRPLFESRTGGFEDGFSRVDVVLTPYDTNGNPARYPDPPPPAAPGPAVRVTLGINVPMVPAAATLLRGVYTLVRDRPPVNVGQALVSDDKHYYDEREDYLPGDTSAPGAVLPAGLALRDFYAREEIPLTRHLTGADSVLGGARRNRWQSAILGSEFHMAPSAAALRGRALPQAINNVITRLESEKTGDFTLDDLIDLANEAVRGWYLRQPEPFMILTDEINFAVATAPAATGALGDAVNDAVATELNTGGVPDTGDDAARVVAALMMLPQTSDESCVIEPLGFLPILDVEYDSPGSFLDPTKKVRSDVAPIAYLRWHESDSESRGHYPGRFEVLGGNVNEVRRYDGSFTRGFLATPRVAEIMAAYYTGGDGWRGGALPSGEFVSESATFDLLSPTRGTTGTLNLALDSAQTVWANVASNTPGGGVPLANEHIRLRNPLSHLWQSRRVDSKHTELLGARRLQESRARELVRQKICLASSLSPRRLREGVGSDWCLLNQNQAVSNGMTIAVAEDSPYDFLQSVGGAETMMWAADSWGRRFGAFTPRLNTMMMMMNLAGDFDNARVRAPFVPLGVKLNPGAGDGTRPIQSLRLPHAIRTPVRSRIRVPAGGLGYPTGADSYFAFPAGSRAMMMHMDMSSWESIHPGLAATRSGMTYQHASATTAVFGTIAYAPRRIGTGDVPGEAFSNFDISGRRILHYQRSESSPAEEPTSARQVHSNAWIRLDSPSVLERNGRQTRLEEGTVINPIQGTYVNAPRRGLRGDKDAILPYASDAQAVGETPLRLLRPALVLPKGAKLVLQGSSGTMRKVKAAIFISPAPLKKTECSVARGGSVDQTLLGGLLADNRTPLTRGHPCAWLDEEENLDGDRVFIYRNRPSWNTTNTRVVVNDRVVLLGGELEF